MNDLFNNDPWLERAQELIDAARLPATRAEELALARDIREVADAEFLLSKGAARLLLERIGGPANLASYLACLMVNP